MAETIIIAILSSSVLSALITGVFQLLQNRKSRKKGVEAKVDKIAQEQEQILAAQKKNEKDALRTQLLVMMSDYSSETQEILTLADRYFRQLEGDWYLTSLFNGWLIRTKTTPPIWFTNKKEE